MGGSLLGVNTLTQDTQAVILALPGDKELLAALGKMSIRHSQLDYILRMTISSVAGLSKEKVLEATRLETSGALRKRLRKLAKRRFGEVAILLQLEALLERAKVTSNKRNDLIHSVWAHQLDGDPVKLDHANQFQAPPSKEKFEEISEEIHDVTFAFIEARQFGFLRARDSSRYED